MYQTSQDITTAGKKKSKALVTIIMRMPIRNRILTPIIVSIPITKTDNSIFDEEKEELPNEG